MTQDIILIFKTTKKNNKSKQGNAKYEINTNKFIFVTKTEFF